MWGQVNLPNNQSYEDTSSSIEISHPSVDEESVHPFIKFAQSFFGITTHVPITSNYNSIQHHPSRSILAIAQSNVLSVYLLDSNSIPNSLGKCFTLTRHKLYNSTILCLAWTYEYQNTFLLSLSNSTIVYAILPSSMHGSDFDSTHVEFRSLSLPNKSILIDTITTSPQGRLFACGSTTRPGVVYIGDAWRMSLLHCIDRSDSLLQLYWMRDLPTIVVTQR
jgi:hypothetical protein